MILARNYIRALSIPAAVYLVLLVVLFYSRFFSVERFFFEGVSIDLLVTAPLFYLIAARKFKTRLLLVFPLIALGFGLSKLLLPTETNVIHWSGKLLLPLLEVVSLGSISFYIFQFYKEAKRSGEDDVLTMIKKSAQTVFGNNLIAAALTTEIAVVYYSVIAWRKKDIAENQFYSYKENNSLILYGFLIFIILAETFAFHFLFLKINVVFAWIMLGASLYFALQIFAHAKAMSLRPIELKDALTIRYGLAGDVVIRYDQISGVLLTSNYAENDNVIRIGLLKTLEPYSVAIELKEQVELESFYGMKKRGSVLLLPVDNKTEFVKQLKKIIDAD